MTKKSVIEVWILEFLDFEFETLYNYFDEIFKIAWNILSISVNYWSFSDSPM